jgi:hypothetical protein
MINVNQPKNLELFGIAAIHEPDLIVWKRYLDRLMGFVDKRNFLHTAGEAYEFIQHLIRNKEGGDHDPDFYRIMNYILEEADRDEVMTTLDHLFLKSEVLYYLNRLPEFGEQTYHKASSDDLFENFPFADDQDEHKMFVEQSYVRNFYDSVRELEIDGNKLIVCQRYKESLVDVVFEDGRLLSVDDFPEEINCDYESPYWDRIRVSKEGVIKLDFLGRWPAWVNLVIDPGSEKGFKVLDCGSNIFSGMPWMMPQEEKSDSEFYDLDEIGLFEK